MQFESELESGLPGFEGAITRCVVSELPGQVTRWDKVLNAANPFFINLTWNLTGPSVPFITGHWHVRAYFESIGPGPEMEPPPPGSIQMACVPNTYTYNAQLQINPGTIPVPAQDTRPYKVVVTLTLHAPNGTPGPVAGFVDIPVLEFY